jgi:hypothetical protein
MQNQDYSKLDLSHIRISLVLKCAIALWSFCIAIISEMHAMAVFYLVICIVFAGLFVFQLSFYNELKKIRSGSLDDPHRS